MALDLSKVKKSKPRYGQRWIISGAPGMGKTSLALSFPKALMLNIEDGIPADAPEVDSYNIEELEDLFEALEALSEQEHKYKTVIIDSLDALEILATKYICEENKWESLSDVGHGKGYNKLKSVFLELNEYILEFVKRDMQVIMIAHVQIKNVDSPINGMYDKSILKLQNTIGRIMEAESDIIIFIDEDVIKKTEVGSFGKEVKKAVGDKDKRWMFCQKTPGITAKNRIGLPYKLPYNPGNGYKTLKPFLEKLKSG